MPTKDGKLTEADRKVLIAAMDRLIPPVDDLPGAGSMDLAPEAERIAKRIPRFHLALIKTLDALSLDMSAHAYGGFKALPGEEQDAALKGVEHALPSVFAQFLELVYIVYYSDERVHNRIGWRSGPLQPAGFELEPFDESILETTRKREPFWRRVPASTNEHPR